MKLANLVQLIFLGTTLASPLHPVMSRPGEPGLATHAGSPERHGPFHGGLPPNETHWPVEPDEPPYDPCEGEPDEPYDSPPFWWPPHEPEGGYGGYPEPYFGDGDDDNEGPEWGPFSSGPEWEPDSDSPWYPWESDNGDD